MQMGKKFLVPLTPFLLLTATTALAQSAKISGRVMDSSGYVMPGAQIKVYQGDTVVKEGMTTPTGDFEIPLEPGDYKIEVAAPDFNTYTEMVKVTPDLGPLSITMQLAQIEQSIEVTETPNQISIDPDSSLNTTVLDSDFIDALPDDEDQLTAYLQEIAGSRGGAGNNGTFVIDGFDSGRVPPKDQIQEIRINNNPYSAEFSGPGFGRVEIVTKAGTGDYHGNMRFNFNDGALNARNPFADTKPPYQQRNFISNFSGPIIRNRMTLSMTARNFSRENSDTIRAILPTGQLATPIVMPRTNRALDARTQLALTPNNTLNMNIEYRKNDNRNQGVGGFNLAERASDRTSHSAEIQLRDTAILTNKLIHEVRFQYRRDTSQQIPRTNDVAINVLDSFFAGGGQNLSRSKDRTLEFNNLLMYSGTKWTFKTGFQGVYRTNHSFSENNFNGTFTFSSLADYIAGKPTTYKQSTGNPELDLNQFELGSFLQADWKTTKNLNLSMGLRYQAQTNIGDYNNFDPRLGFAYQFTDTLALRGGVGVFHDRLDVDNVSQVLLLDGTRQQEYVIQFPSYPDPFLTSSGSIEPLPPTSIRVFSPDLVTPYTINSSISLEKTLSNGIGLTFSWDSIRGVHQYRSRNINAPLPGSLVRPDPSQGNVEQLESTGLSRSNNYTIGFRQRLRNRWNMSIFANYTLGFSNNDTDGSFSLPADNYDLHSEWGRSGRDVRHRFFTGVNFALPWQINVNTNINATSNRPYNITTGFDDNGDTELNDRPAGVNRNSGIGPGLFNMGLYLTKTISLKHSENAPDAASNVGTNSFAPPQRGGGFPGGGFPGGGRPGQGGRRGGGFPDGRGPGGRRATQQGGPTMAFVCSIRNLLNNQQLNGFSGVMTSPFFGRANSARNPRQIEVGLRFGF